jgi:flagellar FliL protein
MSVSKIIAVLVTVTVVAVGVGAGTTWWLMKGGNAAAAPAPEQDPRDFKYVSLEKVIVMLRGGAGEPVPHYLALDLVFKTPLEDERVTREHLPLLRSIAVKALSNLTMDNASRMSVEELTTSINQAYAETYAADRSGRPFVDVMIGKLIVE